MCETIEWFGEQTYRTNIQKTRHSLLPVQLGIRPVVLYLMVGSVYSKYEENVGGEQGQAEVDQYAPSLGETPKTRKAGEGQSSTSCFMAHISSHGNIDSVQSQSSASCFMAYISR